MSQTAESKPNRFKMADKPDHGVNAPVDAVVAMVAGIRHDTQAAIRVPEIVSARPAGSAEPGKNTGLVDYRSTLSRACNRLF